MVVKEFTEASKIAIDQGAEVLILSCNFTANVLTVLKKVTNIDGVPIIDAYGLLARTVKTMLKLKEEGITRKSLRMHDLIVRAK